jgi:HPt (histidine-containing phosphotransfer) domain-containing protein
LARAQFFEQRATLARDLTFAERNSMSSILTLPAITNCDGSPPNAAISPSHWILPEMLLDLAEDGSVGLIADLIDAFRTDTQLRLKQVRRALGDSDPRGVLAGIHSIKGCGLQMGANAMASMCLDIERAVAETPAVQLSEPLKGLETEFEQVCHAMAEYVSVHPPYAPQGSMAESGV